MGTGDYARIFRRSWLLILVVAVLGVLVAWAVTATTKPVYAATSVAFVASETGGTLNELTQGNAFTERRVSTYANLVTEPIVTASIIEDFGLNVSAAAFAANVSVSIPIETTLLEVTVVNTSPEVAASVANALITNLALVVAEIETTAVTVGPVAVDGTLPRAAPPVKITQVRFADSSSSPVSPNIPLNLAIGLFAGLALGTLAAILRDVIDTRIRSLQDIEAVASPPIVGAIPQAAKARSGAILAHDDRGSPTAESFRILRTNLQFLDIDGPATFVVTSPSSNEGKSTVSVNLAATIAANGTSVLLVEADLRRPRVHQYLGVEGGAGLTDILIGRAEFADVVQSWASPNLHVLASGRVPPNPSELLGSQQMREFMLEVQDMYDVVLYDTPPVLPVPDAAILSRNVGGVLLVIAIGHTRRDEARAGIASLKKVSARVAGIIANRVAGRGSTSYLTEAYSTIDPYRENTSGSPEQWHQNLADTHGAQTQQTTAAPGSTTATADAGEGGLPGGNAAWDDDQRAVDQSRSRSRAPLGESRSDTLP